MKKVFSGITLLLMSVTVVLAQNVDLKKSEVKWTGKKVTGEHWGYVSLKSANLAVNDDGIDAGSFVIDMSSITNEDMEAGEWHDKLVGHLKSDDFFGTEKFPESKLVITEPVKLKDGKGQAKADLTIKGKTHPINFEVVKVSNGYNAILNVNRTKYDIKYGSGSFFEGLGDKMIYDDFTLEVKLVL